MSARPRVVARRGGQALDPAVRRYMERCVSPLAGLVRTLRVVSYDAENRALVTVLPELVELHRRAGVERPDYHLGGFGFSLNESVMKALGESVERAAHFLLHVHRPELFSRHAQAELRVASRAHVPVCEFGRFRPEQLAHPRSPVRAVDEETPISWVRMLDLRGGGEVLLPAQAVLAGFPSRDEPRAFVGITTGTAAHVDRARALRGAFLELLQVDATVGHWYSASTAPRIEVSPRSTPRLARFLARNAAWLDRVNGRCEFYALRQPERMPVYVAACVIRRDDGFPALMIGHGVETDLEHAMYRALYEAVPISLVTHIQVLRQMFGEPKPGEPVQPRAASVRALFGRLDPGDVTDLETGVAWYALPENAAGLFPARFDPGAVVGGPDLYREVAPAWRGVPPEAVCGEMLRECARHFRLYGMDLTTEDLAALGFRVLRVYSPDLMSLPLPSFPEAAHPRFAAYGGFRSAAPHPYP